VVAYGWPIRKGDLILMEVSTRNKRKEINNLRRWKINSVEMYCW
jgi:hypothetical protein